jgi:hypothetical protein
MSFTEVLKELHSTWEELQEAEEAFKSMPKEWIYASRESIFLAALRLIQVERNLNLSLSEELMRESARGITPPPIEGFGNLNEQIRVKSGVRVTSLADVLLASSETSQPNVQEPVPSASIEAQSSPKEANRLPHEKKAKAKLPDWQHWDPAPDDFYQLPLPGKSLAELSMTVDHAAHPWIYPLFCAAAHTGARRSELLRTEVTDVDFGAGTLLIREKKRSRRQRTNRHVSLTPFLMDVLKGWLAVHPGGRFLFCQAGTVARSRKRSLTTGHKGEKTRKSSLKGRKAGVRVRQSLEVAPVTKDEAHDHLRRTLAGSKWESLSGYHVLRHSFISCLAAAGVDQRIIDDFVGHQTDEQRRRYRHLYPEVKQKAIADVFG